MVNTPAQDMSDAREATKGLRASRITNGRAAIFGARSSTRKPRLWLVVPSADATAATA